MAESGGNELPDFKSRIAGFQARVSGENKAASIGSAMRATHFVQKLKGAWQRTKEDHGKEKSTGPPGQKCPEKESETTIKPAIDSTANRPYVAPATGQLDITQTKPESSACTTRDSELDTPESERQTELCLKAYKWWVWRQCLLIFDAWAGAVEKHNDRNAYVHSNQYYHQKDSQEQCGLYQAPMRQDAVAMEVVGCPSVAVLGRNRVYLPAEVHSRFAKIQSTILGIPPIASEPVLICINHFQFEAWAAPELKAGTVALDSVQALTVSACLGDVVHVWPLDVSEGLCHVDCCTLTVRLKDKSSHVSFAGLDKNKFSEHCFNTLQGHPLCKGQRILIGFGYWRMELCVDSIDDPWASILAAFHMGKHPRLGSGSWVFKLPLKILTLVSKLFWKGACRSTLVGPSCKQLYNFWNGSLFEGARAAEGVCGMGYEEVLIRGVGPRTMSPQPSHINRSNQAARPAGSLVAPFFESTYHQMKAPLAPSALVPGPECLLFESSISPPLNVGAVRTNPSRTAASQQRPAPCEWHVSNQSDRPSPSTQLAGSPSDVRSRMQDAVSGSQSSGEELKTKLLAMRDMLINAGLEHEETLLQLDEMSALAAASLQRENKYVQLFNNVVSRNQAKGGDWTHLAHILEDYSEDIFECLQTVDRQAQSTTSSLPHPLRYPAAGASQSSVHAPTLSTVAEGQEHAAADSAEMQASTCRANESEELKAAREHARMRAGEAQRIHELALTVPRDARAQYSAIGRSASATMSSGPVPNQQDVSDQIRGARETKRVARVAEYAKEIKDEILRSKSRSPPGPAGLTVAENHLPVSRSIAGMDTSSAASEDHHAMNSGSFENPSVDQRLADRSLQALFDSPAAAAAAGSDHPMSEGDWTNSESGPRGRQSSTSSEVALQQASEDSVEKLPNPFTSRLRKTNSKAAMWERNTTAANDARSSKEVGETTSVSPMPGGYADLAITLNHAESRVMDAADDELEQALSSGTLPPEIQSAILEAKQDGGMVQAADSANTPTGMKLLQDERAQGAKSDVANEDDDDDSLPPPPKALFDNTVLPVSTPVPAVEDVAASPGAGTQPRRPESDGARAQPLEANGSNGSLVKDESDREAPNVAQESSAAGFTSRLRKTNSKAAMWERNTTAANDTRSSKEVGETTAISPNASRLKDKLAVFQSESKRSSDEDAPQNVFKRPSQLLAPKSTSSGSRAPDAESGKGDVRSSADGSEGNPLARRKSFVKQASFSGSIKKLRENDAEKASGLKKLGSPFAHDGGEQPSAGEPAVVENMFGRPTAAQLLAGNT